MTEPLLQFCKVETEVVDPSFSDDVHRSSIVGESIVK